MWIASLQTRLIVSMAMLLSVFSWETSFKKFSPDPFQELLENFCYKIGDCYALPICNSSHYHFGSASQNGPQDSFYMEILCFYVNSAFGKKGFPNVLAHFFPISKPSAQPLRAHTPPWVILSVVFPVFRTDFLYQTGKDPRRILLLP